MKGFISKLFGTNEEKKRRARRMAPKFEILRRLFNARSTITVSFPEIKDQFISLILEIDEENEKLLIDELTPRHGNRYMEEGLPFHASCSDHGIAVRFKSFNVKTLEDNGIPYYRIQVPEQVHYKQLRDAFRTKIPMFKPVSLTIRSRELKTYSGSVADMSMTGCRVQFEENLTEKFFRGETVLAVQLDFGEEHMPILADVEICHNVLISGTTNTSIGLKFAELEQEAQAFLNQFLNTVQREQRRKEAGLD